MARITLSNGLSVIIDDEDLPTLSKYTWHAQPSIKTIYAIAHGPGKRRPTIRMHRLLIAPRSDQQIDHINGNGLDNRKANLRICNNQENGRNKPKAGSQFSSRFKGVRVEKSGKRSKKFRACIKIEGKEVSIGYFKAEEEAAWAYDREARARFGFFARTNFPLPPMVIPEAT